MRKALLVAVALSPAIFLGILFLLRTGRNLTLVFLTGAGILFVFGLGLAGFGHWKRKQEVVVCGASLLAIVLALIIFPCTGMWWVGQKTTPLTVIVRDAGTRAVIPNAFVRLFAREDKARATTGHTDADGKIALTHDFFAAGTDSIVQRTGYVSLGEQTLAVDAKGYEPSRERLDRYGLSSWDLYELPLPDVEVRLKKK